MRVIKTRRRNGPTCDSAGTLARCLNSRGEPTRSLPTAHGAVL